MADDPKKPEDETKKEREKIDRKADMKLDK